MITIKHCVWNYNNNIYPPNYDARITLHNGQNTFLISIDHNGNLGRFTEISIFYSTEFTQTHLHNDFISDVNTGKNKQLYATLADAIFLLSRSRDHKRSKRARKQDKEQATEWLTEYVPSNDLNVMLDKIISHFQ